MDRNSVELSGTAISDPTNTKLSSKASLTTFLLQVNELFSSGGKRNYHPNVITVESLGKHAETVLERVKKGGRYEIAGYLRTEGGKVTVRTFAVTKQDRDDVGMYCRGLEVALEAILSSRDLKHAAEKVRDILAEASQ